MAEQRSPWLYIGCGCAALVVAVTVMIAAMGYFGVRELTQNMTDPEVRTTRALELLGTDTLPEGYNTQFFFRVPLLMEMVILSDGEPAVGGEGLEALEDHEHIFFFMKVRADGAEQAELERYLEGEESNSQILDQIDVDFRDREVVARGRIDLDGNTVRYLSHSGEIRDGGQRVAGLMTLATVSCPSQKRLQVAVWLQRQLETAGDEAVAETETAAGDDGVVDETDEAFDVTGTVADPARLRAFLSQFELCPG